MAKESKLTITGLTKEQKIQQWFESHPIITGNTTGDTIDEFVKKDVSGTTKSLINKKTSEPLLPKFSLSSFTGFTGTTSFKSESKVVKSDTAHIFSAHTKVSKITKGVKQPPVAKPKESPNPQKKPSGMSPTQLKSKVKTTLNSITNNLNFTAGTVDTSFPYGVNTGFDSDVLACKIQSDGKILVGGEFNYYYYNGDSYYAPSFIRLNSDGSPDFDFEYTFLAVIDGDYLNGDVITIAIQSDGKILVGGNFNYYYGYDDYYSPKIIRFNSDGSFDDTFFVGNGFNDTVRNIIVQPDGNILVAGDFYQYNNSQYNPNNGAAFWRICRLTPDGYPDATFDTGYGIDYDDDGTVYTMALQPDGKIILGGDFYNYDGNNVNYIVRINSDGSFDNTFIQGDGFNDVVYSIALQSTGKIIVGGYFDTYNNIDLFNGYIVRLNSNGTMNKRFGYGLDGFVQSLYVQSDDSILVGFNGGQFYPNLYDTISCDELIKFHSDCTFDFSFYHDELLNCYPYTIELQSDGKILIGGCFYNGGNPTLFPLNYFGRLNNAIVNYAYYYKVIDIVQYYDDVVNIYYIVGSNVPIDFNSIISFQSLENPSFTHCGFVTDLYPSVDVKYSYIKTYDTESDALIDNFNLAIIDICTDFGSPIHILVSKNYKIGDYFFINSVIGGMGYSQVFTSVVILDFIPFIYNDYLPISPCQYVPYSSCEESVRANGNIVVLRDCVTDDSNTIITKSILNFGDVVFLPLGDLTNCNYVDDLYGGMTYELYSAGTYTILESVVKYDNCEECLTKTNSGFIDLEFIPNANNDMVFTMVEQPDGKIIIGGQFYDYNEQGKNNIARLNSDGTLDETFNNGGTGFNDKVNAIALLPDGKILVGGNFYQYTDVNNTYYCDYFARLNSDGTFDETFYLPYPNNFVRAIAVQKDGKIVIGGNFNYVDDGDVYSRKFARLHSDGRIDTTLNVGDGFNSNVYKIVLNENYTPPFYTPGDKTYTCEYLIGGQFRYYNDIQARGIIKLNQDGSIKSTFGGGFNIDYGTPRVFDILVQPDGKMIVIGGANDGYYLYDYQGTEIPQNIVRLNADETIDTTFNTIPFYESGGFSSYAISATLQKNGKIIIGGDFDYYVDINGSHLSPSLIRLNSDGTYDDTFVLPDNFSTQINKVLIDSQGKLLVGYWYDYYEWSLIARFFIGEEYKLREFTTCDGVRTNVILPSTLDNNFVDEISYSPLSSVGLDLIFDGDDDDTYYVVDLPFEISFLNSGFTSVNVSSNAYITFGDTGTPDACCFDIPTQIPYEYMDGTGLPGIYISVSNGDNPNTGMDAELYRLYSGLTDGGNTFIIRVEGSYHSNQSPTDQPDLVYNFKFYMDEPNRIDLIIESNIYFFQNNPTGGVSDGIHPTWVTSFNSSSNKSYTIQTGLSKVVKANVDESAIQCGRYGKELKSLVGSVYGGSMYFDGNVNTMVQIDNSGGQFGFGGYNNFTIEWFQYYEGGSNSRPFSIGVYNDPSEVIGMSFEGTVYLWINNNPYNTSITNSDLLNGWHHIAITRYYDGADYIWRVFLDGVMKYEQQHPDDVSNTKTLTLGNQLNDDGRFQGYITNFRITDLEALYTSNFTVPTSPLTCGQYGILLMLANDSNTLITDSCGGQSITQTGVTWSDLTPLSSLPVVYKYTGGTEYNTCNDCTSDFRYETLLYVRDGVNPDYTQRARLTADAINKIQTMGPIFTTLGIECYELLDYWK